MPAVDSGRTRAISIGRRIFTEINVRRTEETYDSGERVARNKWLRPSGLFHYPPLFAASSRFSWYSGVHKRVHRDILSSRTMAHLARRVFFELALRSFVFFVPLSTSARSVERERSDRSFSFFFLSLSLRRRACSTNKGVTFFVVRVGEAWIFVSEWRLKWKKGLYSGWRIRIITLMKEFF